MGPERARLPARARMRTSHTKRCPAKTSEERLKIVIGGLCDRGGRLPPLLCTKSTPWLGYRPSPRRYVLKIHFFIEFGLK